MSDKTSIKRQAVQVPNNLTEAAEILRLIGQERRGIDRITATVNKKIETLKKEAMDKVNPHQDKIDGLMECLYIFAEAHRDELTEGKRKTVKLPTGTFGWRKTPPAVRVRNLKTAINSIKLLGLRRFLRIKRVEELDKEAILQESSLAKEIRGLSIVQREEFVVTPAKTKIEILYGTLKKPKRRAR